MGRLIVCTIHQPSSDIFYLFDSLLIVADGELVYEVGCVFGFLGFCILEFFVFLGFGVFVFL
jgi:hypothetical protein